MDDPQETIPPTEEAPPPVEGPVIKINTLTPEPGPVETPLPQPAPVEFEPLAAVTKIFSPAPLLVAPLVMIPTCLLLGDIFDFAGGGYVVASFVFFAVFALLHGILSALHHCRFEGTPFAGVLVAYLKKTHSFLPPLLAALVLLASLSLGMGLAYHIQSPAGSFALMFVVGLAFLSCAWVYTMIGGYWHAIVASEVSGIQDTYGRLSRTYARSFRTVARHSALNVLLSFGVFAVSMLPSVAVAMMHFKTVRPSVEMKDPLLAANFGLSMALALSALAAGTVLSHRHIVSTDSSHPL